MILPDVIEEAVRLTDAATAAGVPVRVLGGVAIALHADGGIDRSLARSYGDIDLVTTRGSGREAERFLKSAGYVPNARFNAIHSASRLVVYDLEHKRQIDVFVGEFSMCHRIPIADRLDLEPRTIPLAELLATKLQIVELNRKDINDILTLLHGHEVGLDDNDTINAGWLAKLLAADWGLWRTARGTVEATRAALAASDLDAAAQGLIDERLTNLWRSVEAEPKSRRWRARARIGDRVRWYEEPEEIAHQRD